ncbi:rhodanese-like domain-containing protein [Candidatus Pelagibacter communis]|uniref:rhodanese-like domain-containing protein n=1 Tax=Pelagibacter ubique TaxID=198252 RepID=UPI00094C8972|nr:rhodanese-like domain-containing protein [Candidatus Pelagibacter ubique]
MSLVTTDWVLDNLNSLKIIDASWHMPAQKRNPAKEYLNAHIPNSIFFDLDENSEKDTDLPHMLPKQDAWEKIMSSFGINNNDDILIYDNSDLKSSCRCWFSLLYFGHDEKKIHILNGGLKKWIFENKPTTKDKTEITESNYVASEKENLVVSLDQIKKNILNKKFNIIDARSRERFEGKVPEPRKGLRSGHIKNSFCIPFNQCINQKTGEFKSLEELKKLFEQYENVENKIDLVFTCGSGVTASVLAYAYKMVNNDYIPKIYDGSWSEYGKYPA